MPIDIDNIDVSEITIDGQNVNEVTADGEVVFQQSEIPDSALTQDLIAWYRFEDGDARDYASSAEFPNVTWGDSTSYDGTVNGPTFQSSGGVTDFENGPNSGAFEFDNSQAVVIPHNESLNFGNNITISAWINPRTTMDNMQNSFPGIYSKGGGGGSGTYFLGSMLPDSNRLGFRVSNGSNFRDTRFDFTDTSYSMITGTYDGSEIRIYKNASLKSSDVINQNVNTNNANISLFGKNEALGDELRIYNRALTASEISDIYNATEP